MYVFLFDFLTFSNKNAHEKDCETLSLGHPVRLLHQLVCCTELTGEQKLVEKDTFKKYLSGDWMDHLSITGYLWPTSTNQINIWEDCHQQSPLVNQTLFSQQVSRNMTRNCNQIYLQKKPLRLQLWDRSCLGVDPWYSVTVDVCARITYIETQSGCAYFKISAFPDPRWLKTKCANHGKEMPLFPSLLNLFMCVYIKKIIIQRALVSLEDLIERKVIAQVWHKLTALHISFTYIIFFQTPAHGIFSGTVKWNL